MEARRELAVSLGYARDDKGEGSALVWRWMLGSAEPQGPSATLGMTKGTVALWSGSDWPAYGRMLPEAASPGRGTAAKGLLEFAGEMELVAEAGALTYFGDGETGVEQQIGRDLQPFCIELFHRGRLTGEPAQFEQMLARGSGRTGNLIQRKGTGIALINETLHAPQRRLRGFRRLAGDGVGKVAQDCYPKRLEYPDKQKVCGCRGSKGLPRDVEQRGHTAKKGKRSAEVRELSFKILIQDFGPNGNPTVARLAIAGKVELLKMTWTEKNCVVFLDLQHFSSSSVRVREPL